MSDTSTENPTDVGTYSLDPDPTTTAPTPSITETGPGDTGDAAEESGESGQIEAAEKKERRPRGWLETDVKQITDKFTQGEITLKEGEFLTPHRIANLVKQLDGLDAAPSTGAVAAVLNRWVEIDFIKTNQKPYAFVDYTDAAREEGLAALKAKRSTDRKAARKAAKEEAKANAPATPQAAETVSGATDMPVDGTPTPDPGPAMTATDDSGGYA